jgi:hypothetical protein
VSNPRGMTDEDMDDYTRLNAAAEAAELDAVERWLLWSFGALGLLGLGAAVLLLWAFLA